ncbi:copper amine oxidase N-terminal domain-containing protein [Paenibacillus sp. MBLB4367]|uniref:copper amine oxidase N-terminal domain-containing protein n=1 Tax=Paenibacillus sp. MBLB4367 TaxID=3384767 RepID=UPI0039083ABD
MKKKKSMILSVVLLMLFASVSVAHGESRKADAVTVDGKAVVYRYGEPFVQQNVDLVPIRDLLVALGVPNDDEHIVWNGEERSVTAVSGKGTLKMALDQVELYKNGSKTATFLTAPQLADGRFYIPVREVAEAYGYKVTRDLSKGVISVASEAYIASQQPPDQEGPSLVTAVALTGTVVEVKFSEKMDKATAETAASYTIQSDAGRLTVSRAELQSDQMTVKLTVAEQIAGTIYKVSVTGIKGANGNVNGPSAVYFGGIMTLLERESSLKLALLSAVSAAPTTVIATFNKDLDRTTAEQVQNYVFEDNKQGYGPTVLKAKLMDNKRAVVLTTTTQPTGVGYKLTVSNVKSAPEGQVVADTFNTYQFGGLPQDSLGLRAISAIAVSNSTVEILFNQTLNKVTAETAANYKAAIENGNGEAVLTVANAELIEGGRKVRLLLSWGMQKGSVYKITMSNIKDTNGFVIKPENQYTRFFGVSAE